jgi:protein-disulfide isomerase
MAATKRTRRAAHGSNGQARPAHTVRPATTGRTASGTTTPTLTPATPTPAARETRKASAVAASTARGVAVGRQSQRPGQRRRSRAARDRRGVWTLSAVVAGVVVLIAYLIWPRAHPQQLSPAQLANDPAIGPASAPVTIVEYADFGCPTCKAWHQAGILKQVLAKYGDKVRFVWRDFPVITADSPKAAEAGRCANDQGKFWPFHDLVYTKAPAISVSDLKAYAAQAGLDTAAFDDCLDSGREAATVQASLSDAEARGFTGTPSFLVNGNVLAGPPSFDELSRIIDADLPAR